MMADLPEISLGAARRRGPAGGNGHRPWVASPHVTAPSAQPDPLGQLSAAIAGGSAGDPFAPVTVVVPSPFARVQLRRAAGARRGLCNVLFRTWGEVVSDLARPLAGGRPPTARTVNEALRQTLLETPSPFRSFAESPIARSELVGLLYDLWHAGPPLISRLESLGRRAAALVEVLSAVEAFLARHGFLDPGRMLENAAAAAVDPGVLGLLVRWCPRPDRGRDRAVVEHLVESGITVSTIAAELGPGHGLGVVTACSDPDEEARVVTRSLLRAAEDGIPLWRQAVVHPPNDRYRRVVHRQLAAAELPICGTSPVTLAQSATGRTLLGLLDLAGGEWRRAEVMRWLAVAPVTTGPGDPRAPVDRWDQISARAGVVEGLEHWRNRLVRFSAIGATDDPHVAHDERDAHAARSLLDFVERLDHELTLPGGRWSEWARWARRLLDLHLDPEDRTDAWPEAEGVAARRVRAVLDGLAELDAVAPGADLTAFGQAVEEELATPLRDDGELAVPGSEGEADPAPGHDRGLPGPVGTGVFVGTPSEARGLLFARVYLVGMADQFVPGLIPAGGLIPDVDIDDPEWPSRERRSQELVDDLATVLRSPRSKRSRPGHASTRDPGGNWPPPGGSTLPASSAPERAKRWWTRSRPTCLLRRRRRCRSRRPTGCSAS